MFKHHFISDQRHNVARPRDARRGAAAVEFAVTAPIFFLFLLAAFEFGWLNVMRHTADNAAYEAARAAIVPGATADDAKKTAKNMLKIVGARGAKITITPKTITSDTQEVTVDVVIPMKKNGLITPRFTSKTKIHSSSTLRTERPDQTAGT
ncbi:MAG TPA: TadE/TadG family type IV pilus assembly protein [Lacipirellulaceae bacterium]|nr:TadE/TadG family type IV pilus assembly protein [Lacipirellulaceae bacterium]